LLLAAFASLALAAELGPSMDGVPTIDGSVRPADTGAWTGCSDQFLAEGVQLPELPFFYNRIAPDNTWGTPALVDLVVEAGRHMSVAAPGASPFTVGDLSRKGGGYNAGHRSHRGGVDADIGLYALGGVQRPNQFTTLAPSQLDLPTTWELIRFLLDSGRVDYILLDRSLIAALSKWTVAQGILSQQEASALFLLSPQGDDWSRTGVVRHAPGHRHHLHVRVLCSDGTRPGY
jgi:murein endopeptidase